MTREEAIAKVKGYLTDLLPSEEYDEVEEIIKSLEQEPILDKIRAEMHATAEMHEDGDYYLRDEWIDYIFDKYKSESITEQGLSYADQDTLMPAT